MCALGVNARCLSNDLWLILLAVIARSFIKVKQQDFRFIV